jgi:hypothetical protein
LHQALGVVPSQCTALVNARTTKYLPPTFKLINIGNKKDLIAALLEVANSKVPNYIAIARKHNIHLLILSCYTRNITISRAIATKILKRLLTNI